MRHHKNQSGYSSKIPFVGVEKAPIQISGPIKSTLYAKTIYQQQGIPLNLHVRFHFFFDANRFFS